MLLFLSLEAQKVRGGKDLARHPAGYLRVWVEPLVHNHSKHDLCGVPNTGTSGVKTPSPSLGGFTLTQSHRDQGSPDIHSLHRHIVLRCSHVLHGVWMEPLLHPLCSRGFERCSHWALSQSFVQHLFMVLKERKWEHNSPERRSRDGKCRGRNMTCISSNKPTLHSEVNNTHSAEINTSRAENKLVPITIVRKQSIIPATSSISE